MENQYGYIVLHIKYAFLVIEITYLPFKFLVAKKTNNKYLYTRQGIM